MNKVTLTKEQAKALKIAIADYGSDNVMNAHSRTNWGGKLGSLNDLFRHELARALYIGYEVEPEFEIGDWVKSLIGKGIGKITIISNLGFHTDFAFIARDSEIKHATEEEIAEEKKRRWWAKHDRGVWELRKRDLLVHKNGGEILSVVKVEIDGVRFTYGGKIIREPFIYNYKIVCFAEDRKDA